MAGRGLEVVLYGATGYTGRMVAQELDAQGARFAIAGRSRERLEALAGELESEPEVLVASVDDGPALEAVCRSARCVASAAGPFKDLGPPVLEAALATGRHYVDTTGEQGFLRWCQDQDARARQAGSAVVNAAGFDVIPSDLAGCLAAEAVDDVVELEIALSTNSRFSDGTRQTMAVTTGDWWEHRDGAFRFAVPGRHLRTFELPGRGTKTGVFLPWGDCVTAPWSTGARTVRTYFLLPEARARWMHRTWPLQWAVAKLPGIGRLLSARASDDRRGPAPGDREESWFTILAEATGAGGEEARALVQGTDPYGLTGAATARMALALARGAVEAPGVQTPTQAFGAERICKMLPGFIEEARPVA